MGSLLANRHSDPQPAGGVCPGGKQQQQQQRKEQGGVGTDAGSESERRLDVGYNDINDMTLKNAEPPTPPSLTTGHPFSESPVSPTVSEGRRGKADAEEPPPPADRLKEKIGTKELSAMAEAAKQNENRKEGGGGITRRLLNFSSSRSPSSAATAASSDASPPPSNVASEAESAVGPVVKKPSSSWSRKSRVAPVDSVSNEAVDSGSDPGRRRKDALSLESQRRRSSRSRGLALSPSDTVAALGHGGGRSAAAIGGGAYPIGRSAAWLIAYCATPLILIPFAWPWVVLKAIRWACLFSSGTAAAAVDVTIVVAELLRKNRGNIARSLSWMTHTLLWAEGQYWAALSFLSLTLTAWLTALTAQLWPAARSFLRHTPALEALVMPLLRLADLCVLGAESVFCTLHDEIVPVALDWAERLPLIPELLTHVTGQ